MRIAGSTLTFSRGGLAEALAQVAEIGFTEIELAAIEGWAHVSPARLAEDPPGELGRVRQELERHGMRVVAINSGLGGGPPAQREVRGRAVLDLAGRLGAGVVTLPPAGLRAENVRERSGEELALLARLVDAARAAGVVLAVEGHMGGVTEDPASAAALCRAVPGLGLTLDPSHYWAGSAQGQGWEVVAPHVAHVHLRDAGRGGWGQIQLAPGTGEVDFPRVLDVLAQAGYRGAFSEEYIDTLPVVGGQGAAEAARALARLAAGWAWPPTG